MNITAYSKAVVPVAVAVGLFLLSKVGITANMSVQDGLTMVVTSGLVYLVPNKK